MDKIDIKAFTKRQFDGCIITTPSGIKLFTPDGHGNYRALWLRDFYYMIDEAGDLLNPEDIRAALEFLFSHARAEDAWMPDRVYPDGKTAYTAGDWDESGIALPNLDNNAYAVLATKRYLELSQGKDVEFLDKWKDLLLKGLHNLPVNNEGMIYNDPEHPHSPYGFTDCIVKTGLLCMESLIYWEALSVAQSWGDSLAAIRKQQIESSFERTFFPDGCIIPIAATVDCCHQKDLWAAVYALAIHFPLSDQCEKQILAYLSSEYDQITRNGQLRHTESGEPWDKTFIPVEPGTYQNGAYWATPLKWFVPALMRISPALARHCLDQALQDFEAGCCECINGDYRKLPDYVVSATSAYYAWKYLNT